MDFLKTDSPLAEQQPEILLKVKEIVKNYWINSKKLEVLKGISFSLKKGEIAAILGVSGAGKSTLLNVIGTLDRPDSGSVILADKIISNLPENKLAFLRNRYIGFVFQFHYLLPEFTALENVAMPGLIGKQSKKVVFDKARRLLTTVNMEERLHHKPNELSGGELQRVAVARALINEPVLVLADEPTGNLDRLNGDVVFDLILSLSRVNKCAFLVVTHNEQIASQTDRIFTLSDGIIIETQN
jgi:lipoprotein-releasing system ATP-binding protein